MKRSLSDTELLRAQDLLVQRATEGLSADEHAELERLGAEDVDELDLAAAATAVAVTPRASMPASLAAKLLAAAPGQNTSTAPAVPTVAATLPDPEPRRVSRPARRIFASHPRFVGALLAAAGVVLAVGAWGFALTRDPAVSPAASAPATRAELARTTDDVVETRWRGTASELRGTVAWSANRQRIVVELAGLPTLAATERFQLWLFDEARDARYPLDGGLFAPTGAAPVSIAVTPPLPIERLVKLVVTVEDTRGVVVSKFDRVVGTATFDQN